MPHCLPRYSALAHPLTGSMKSVLWQLVKHVSATCFIYSYLNTDTERVRHLNSRVAANISEYFSRNIYSDLNMYSDLNVCTDLNTDASL